MHLSMVRLCLIWFNFLAYFGCLTSIEGFSLCRPLLSIDGTHLYGKYRDCLLIATRVDTDGELYPLAFVIVETESENSWRWFLQCIYNLMPSVHNNRIITFISDQMKRLPKALANAWPSLYHHCFCLRHIKANFQKEFKNP